MKRLACPKHNDPKENYQMFAVVPDHRKKPAEMPGREALEGTRARIEQHVGARRRGIRASINVAAVVSLP